MNPYYDRDGIIIYHGDCLEVIRNLPNESVSCCITSPPYWGLRDYGHKDQLGLEKTPEEYTAKMVEVFREVKRVLKNDGTLWLNLGDTYSAQRWTKDSPQKMNKMKDLHRGLAPEKQSGIPDKNLVGIPWRVAFALQADGWYLRQDIIWHKPNPMPESVTDRCTKAHEYIFLMSKSARYYYDAKAIAEPACGVPDLPRYHGDGQVLKEQKDKGGYRVGSTQGERNRRSVWTIATKPYTEAHFATFPEDLVEPMIKAGCPEDGVVLDPFVGSGTTLAVSKRYGRKGVGFELNPVYCDLAVKRIEQIPPNLPFGSD